MLFRNIILCLFFCFQFLLSQSISYENSWAVVIGINDYAKEDIPDLNYAVSDAESIREMLIDYYGFEDKNITLLLNEQATAVNIKTMISGLSKKASKNDRIVIFYAGHGMTESLPSGGEMGYLVPHDGDMDDLYISSIAMKELRNMSDRFDARHVLFLVDACYGGLAAVGTRGLSNQIGGYYDKIFRGKSRQIITAGGKGETVIEKADWGHSAFTHNLLRGLKDWMADLDNDGYITGEELGIYLKRRVTEDSELHQTPTVGRFTTDQGEFMFSRPEHLGGVVNKTPIQNMSNSALPVSIVPKLRPSKSSIKNFNTAKMLALTFPGAGHFYMGDRKKGILWSGIGAASLTGTILMYLNYQSSSADFSKASDTYSNYAGSEAGFAVLYSQMLKARDVKSSAQSSFMALGGIYLGTVLINYFTLRSNDDYDYSYQKVSTGIDFNGHIFINYKF